MRKVASSITIAIASWLFASLTVAKSLPVAYTWEPEPPILQYNTTDGLSQGDVLDVAQDSSGHLWVATLRGINRFDGSEFQKFTKADGLPHNYITAVHTTAGAQVWFADAKGNLTVIDNNVVGRVVALKGLESTLVKEIFEFNGRFILATEDIGLYSFLPEQAQAAPELIRASENETRGIGVRDGSLWFVQDDTLLRWSGASSEKPQVVKDDVLGSFIVNENTHWLVTADHKILRWSGNAAELKFQLPVDQVFTGIIASVDGRVWISTEEGVFGFGDNGLSSFIEIGRVNALFLDRENTLWIGRHGGLYRHLGERFVHYKNRYSRTSTVVWSITQDAAGNFYYGSNTEIQRRSENGGTIDYSELIGLNSGIVFDIVIADDERMYAAVVGSGVYQIDTVNNTARLLVGTEEFKIFDIEIDANGLLWLATDKHGIVSVDVANQSEVTAYKETQASSSYTLSVDPAGNVWYDAAKLGIGVLRRDANNQYTNKLYGAEHNLDKRVFSQLITVDVNEFWAGGLDSVLLHFDNGKITDYTENSPMNDQNIYSVFVQDNGSLLLGGEMGVFQFNPHTGESHGFGPLHGFTGAEVNAHANFIDSQGYLWFGTVDGPTRMDLTKELPESSQLEPSVVSAIVDKSNEFMTPDQQLNYDQRDLQFTFDAVSLLEPFGVEYSFRLRGRDEKWSAPDRIRRINYSGLLPGSYRLELRARYIGGEWYFNPNAFQFEILAPFWRTGWFVGLSAALSALMLYLAIWLRTRAISRHNTRLRAEVLMRTRSIEEGRAQLVESNLQLVAESMERRRADAKRAEIEQRFRVAFQSTPIGMTLIDIHCAVIDSNDAFRKMFVAPDQQDDDNIEISALSFVNEEDKERMRDDVERLLQGQVDGFDAQYKCHRFDGEFLHVHMFLTAVRADNRDLKYCVAQIQDITESRRLTDALEYQANHDDLSGLLNRRSFEKALDTAYAQSTNDKQSSYLMFMDLDQFKIVNDTSGHRAGDELLRQISDLIRDQIRNSDILGRLGGDEFGVILWSCPTDVARRIAEAIRAAVEDFQFRWDTNSYRVGVSVGVVRIDSELGTTAELQQMADAACYHSKDNGRNRVHFVEEELESIDEQRSEVRWVQRLHEAMHNHNFVLYGQIIKPANPGIVGPERMEILLRLRDPETQKIIPPGAFLPAAERYGVIVQLDQWVVENLLRMLYVHHALGSKERHYWVNLSGNSIGDKRFVDFLISAIKDCGLPKGMINFEITETAVIRNVGEAGRLMSALHDMGCKLSLDDFGSGLSSFGYLKKLPVDFIKIDGMFVRDILTDEIDKVFVKSIIDIARTMGIQSIAEFVENTDILEAVRDLGVDYVQGFGVHRPESVFADLGPGAMLMKLGNGPVKRAPDTDSQEMANELRREKSA